MTVVQHGYDGSPHGLRDYNFVVVGEQAKSGGEVASVWSVRVKYVVDLFASKAENFDFSSRFVDKQRKIQRECFFQFFEWPQLSFHFAQFP